MELRVAVWRAREGRGDQHHRGVHREERGDERALALAAAPRSAQELDDDDRSDQERDDEQVDLPRSEVIDGKPGDRQRVVLAPEVRVAAEGTFRRRACQEQARGRVDGDRRDGGERRPQPEGSAPERRTLCVDGPHEQGADEEGRQERRELRSGRVGEADRAEHHELAARRRALERQDHGEQREARREVRRALRQHQRRVDRRGDDDRGSRHGHAPPGRQEPTRDEVDGHGGKREEQGVRELEEGDTRSRPRPTARGSARARAGTPARSRRARPAGSATRRPRGRGPRACTGARPGSEAAWGRAAPLPRSRPPRGRRPPPALPPAHGARRDRGERAARRASAARRAAVTPPERPAADPRLHGTRLRRDANRPAGSCARSAGTGPTRPIRGQGRSDAGRGGSFAACRAGAAASGSGRSPATSRAGRATSRGPARTRRPRRLGPARAGPRRRSAACRAARRRGRHGDSSAPSRSRASHA